MATNLASNNMTITTTSECCSPELGHAPKKDTVSIPSCQERYVTQRMNSFPPTASIIRRKSSLSICCKSIPQRQRSTPVGQRMFEHLLSHEHRKERLLVPDLATEWFRKQKIFLDQVTPEEQLALKQQQQQQQTAGASREPTLMSYVCECRQRCGCGNESSTLQHSVQYLDYCQELRRRRLLLQRQRRQRRQNEPICKCSDPPAIKTKEHQPQQQQVENRSTGGMLRTKPATGTLYPHRTCSCLRNRSSSCACTFQADGQPMSEECRLAVRCRTQTSLMRLRKKCSLRETPQRQLHPACYRRISPEFYSLLKRYEDGMSERYPLYGLPKRYWGKSTPPCCPCEMSTVDPCADECLGDQSLATERVEKEQLEEVEQPKKKLKPKESDPEVEDESEECSCECECEESTDTVIDSCQDDTCFLSLNSEQFVRKECEPNTCENRDEFVRKECEPNTCENRLNVQEKNPSCSSEPCERSLTASYSTEKENIQSDVFCTDATCPNRHEESTVAAAEECRSSRIHFTSGLDPSHKAVGLGNSVSQQGCYRKSRKQRHNADEPQQKKRKGILNSMAGLCKRVMQPGRYLLYNLSTLQRQPTYEKPAKEDVPAAAAQPRWVLPSGANNSSMFSQKPRRGSSKQRKPDQQWTTSQATASGFTTQSSRQLSRHYYSQYSANKNSIQSEHVMDQPFVFSQPTAMTNDSNRVEPEQVPQPMEEVRSTVAASQLTANVVTNDSYNDTSSTVHFPSKLSLSGSQLTAETTETAETQMTESVATSIDTLQPEIVTKKEQECRKEAASRRSTGGPSYAPASDYAELMRIVARKRTRTKQRKRRVVSFADKERNTDKKSTNPMHIARERYKTMPARNRSTSQTTRKRRKVNKVTQLKKSDLKDRQTASGSRAPMYNLLEPAVRGRRQYSEESYANYNRNSRDFRDRRTRDRDSYEYFDNRNSQGNWERNRTRSYERSYNPRDQGYVREYSNQPYYRSPNNNGRHFMQTRNEQLEFSDMPSRSTIQYGSQASNDFRDFQTPYAMSVASYKGYDPRPSGMCQRMSSNSSYQANTPPPIGQQNVERRPHYHVSEPELRDVPVMRRSHSLDSFPSTRRSVVPSQHTQPSNHTTIAKAEQVSNIASTSKQPSPKSSVPRWQSKSKKSEASTSLLPKIFSSKPPINEKLIKLREAAAKVPKVKLKAQHRKVQCSLRTRRPPPPPRRLLMEQLRQQQQMLQSTMDFRQERVIAHQHYEQAEQPRNADDNDNDRNDRNNDSRDPSTTLSFGADKWRSCSGCDMQFRDNDEQPKLFNQKLKAISENSSSIGIQCDRRSFVHTPAPNSMRKSRQRVKVYATPESSDCSLNGSLERKKSRGNKKQSQQSKTNLCWQKADRFKQSEDEEENGRHEFPTNERYERNRPQVIKQGMSRAIVSTGKLLSLPDYGEAGRGIVAKRSKDFDNSYEDDPLFTESFAYPQDSRRPSSSVSDKYAIEPPLPPEIKGKQQRQLQCQPKPSSILKAVAKPLTRYSSDSRRVNFVPRQNNSDSSLEACIDPNKFSCSRYEKYSTVGTPSCYTVQAGTRRPAILRAHTVHNTLTSRDEKPQAAAVSKSQKKLPSLFAVPTTATYTETFNRVSYDMPNADRLAVRHKTQEEHEREQRHLPMNCQLYSKRSDFPNTRIIQSNNDRYMPPSVSLVSDLDFNTHCEHSRNVTAEEMRKAGGGTMQAIDVSLMLATAISRRHHKPTTTVRDTATTSSTKTMQTYQKVGAHGSTRTDRTFPCYADETAGNKDNYCQKRHCCLRRLPEEPVVIEPTHTGLRVQQVRQTCLPVLFYGRKC